MNDVKKQKVSFAKMMNPQTAAEIHEAVKQTTILFVILLVSKMMTAGTSAFLGHFFQTMENVDTAEFPDFLFLARMILLDVIVLSVAVGYYYFKKSFKAAIVIFIVTLLTLYNYLDAYFLSQSIPLEPIKLILAVCYLTAAFVAVKATYRHSRSLAEE